MTEAVIIRHAQSVWNAVGRWQGWADPPLSELGERQATIAGRILSGWSARPAALASSDLQRAHRTAELLRTGLVEASPLGAAPGAALRPVMVDPDLREYDAGEWTGLRRDEIAVRWPGQLEAWSAGELPGPPGGEDNERFVARLWAALGRLDGTVPEVLVVSHGRAIHALATSLGAPARRVEHLSGWHLRLGAEPELLGPVSLLDPSSAVAPARRRSRADSGGSDGDHLPEP